MRVAEEVVWLLHYLDDFWLYGRDEGLVVQTLRAVGFIFSPKSSECPH